MPAKPTFSAPLVPLRNRAEGRLRGSRNGHRARNGGTPPAADTARLLHELQVHQIELEMQNEELRKARDEMEAGLDKYSELYDFAPVGYLTLDREGAIREANLAAAALLDIPRAPLMKQRFGFFVTPADRPVFNAFLAQVFKSGGRQECDVQLLVKAKPPIEVRIRANRFDSGEACRLAVSDISAHTRAEKNLRISELRYRRLFEAAKDGILIIDPKTRKITEANPFIVKVLGYTRAQLIGKELWQIGLLKDEAASQEAFRELKRNGFIRYEDLPLETRGGQRREVEFVSNLYDEGGEAVIQCNIRDITERQQAEAALRTSEERYRVLFDLRPVGVYSCDATGMIQAFNLCAAELWGRKPKLGRDSERFCGSHRLYRPDGTPLPHASCPMAAVLQGKIPLVRDAEVVIERPDRSRITVIVNIVPLRGGGEITGAINCFYDITARKRAEEALRTARAQLAEHAGQLEKLVTRRTAQLTTTNRRLEASIGTIRQGHELIQKLLEESQLMQKKLRRVTHQVLTAQEEERKKISRELHDEVVQTLVGINVELSALVHGNSTRVQFLKDKIVRTQRLVEKSVDAVHRFARDLRPAVLDDLGLIPALHAFCISLTQRKKIKIKFTAFRGVEAMDGDKRTVLFRVAQEALTNVARHARATRVKLSISQHPGAIRLEVADNGMSFPVKKILSAKNNKRLGLVGMKERVEMVGGNLTIESVSGKGTTVRADIPFNSARPKS